jgi:archaellum biogenesis ATPase FlaH
MIKLKAPREELFSFFDNSNVYPEKSDSGDYTVTIDPGLITPEEETLFKSLGVILGRIGSLTSGIESITEFLTLLGGVEKDVILTHKDHITRFCIAAFYPTEPRTKQFITEGLDNLTHGRPVAEGLPATIRTITRPSPPTIDCLGFRFPMQAITILGARPGSGKTLSLLNIARTLLEKGKTVAFFSYEEIAQQLAFKMALSYVLPEDNINPDHTPLDDLEKATQPGNTFPPEGYKRPWETFAGYIHTGALELYDTPGTAGKLTEKIKGTKADVVIIDYVQQIPGDGKQEYSRQIELAKITREIRDTVKRKNATVILAAQLNRDDSKDGLLRLREADDIGNDANLVYLLNRYEYPPDSEKPTDFYIEFDRAKDRNGKNSKRIQFKHNAPVWRLEFMDQADETKLDKAKNGGKKGNKETKPEKNTGRGKGESYDWGGGK